MTNEHSSVEAERELIATCLQFPECVVECESAGISEIVFYEPKHAIVWRAIVALAIIPGRLDTGTLREELLRRDQLAAVGGDSFIVQISTFAASTLRTTYFIERVITLHLQRQLISNASGLLEAAKQPAADWMETWDRAEPLLQRTLSCCTVTRRSSIADVAQQAASYRLNPDTRPTCPTPWPEWDREATPPRAGELIVIAARPGVGKTTLAGNIAADIAASGKSIAFFSLEMSAPQVIDRWAMRRAGRAGIGNDAFANAKVVAQIEAIGRQRQVHILDSQACRSITQIESQCRLLAASPDGLSLVVIDYLQMVTPPADAKGQPREQQVAQMTRRFKLLADGLACPVILLAQLNRESEKEERRPRLSDLRESGSIEQDADRVWFIYRPRPAAHEPLQDEDASEIKVALYQGKCRNGPAGVEGLLTFNRPCFSFG